MITEGNCKIVWEEGVFYNPKMEINRDLLSAAIYVTGAKSFCDGHSATGIKAIRAACENCNVESVDAVDISKKAIALIRKNIVLNKVEDKVKAVNDDVRCVLMHNNYDFVEIDPFGTPAPYFDALAESFSWRKKGYFSVTATDTAVLCGAEAKACKRVYGSIPLHKEFVHESGIRILIARIQSIFASKNIAITPLLSLSHRHYLKIFFETYKSATLCDKKLADIKMLAYCERCLHRKYFNVGEEALCDICKNKTLVRGPFWAGLLHDTCFIEKMISTIEKRNYANSEEELRLLNTTLTENFEGFCYELHTLFRGKHIPKTKEVIKALQDEGFKAAPTIYKNWIIRTTATANEIVEIAKRKELY